jgi:stalled ribosome rescue protein Dom34
MRKLFTKIDKGVGEVKLRPEEPDDLWHVYHLIAVGDRVKASTFRWVGIHHVLVRSNLLSVLQHTEKCKKRAILEPWSLIE